MGTFKEGSLYLKQTGLYDSIKEHSLAGGFLLGICLGMQLLLSSSESLGFDGLNIFLKLSAFLQLPISSSSYRLEFSFHSKLSSYFAFFF